MTTFGWQFDVKSKNIRSRYYEPTSRNTLTARYLARGVIPWTAQIRDGNRQAAYLPEEQICRL